MRNDSWEPVLYKNVLGWDTCSAVSGLNTFFFFILIENSWLFAWMVNTTLFLARLISSPRTDIYYSFNTAIQL